MGLFGKKGKARAYRIFFATDVHGSDRCFRKFLAAADAYSADALVLGGDVAGKAMVPIIAGDDGHYEFTFQGISERVEADALEEVSARMNFNGFYPRVMDRAEHERLDAAPGLVAELFDEIIAEQVSDWCDLAAERLGDEVKCVITPGNDDPLTIDKVLADATAVDCPERATMALGPVWLASLGNVNRTPWDTDREYDEDELTRQIDEMVGPVADGRPLVFNFHCPPYDTGLDTAAKLDADFRPVLDHGNVVEIPVGSTAVRDAIDRYQPVCGLHGHIHESAGSVRLGDSWCFNPGSDYSSGVLKGLIVDFAADGSFVNHMFTNG